MGSEYFVDMISAVVAVEYMGRGFKKKYSGRNRFLFFALGCAVYFLVLVVLNHVYVYEGAAGFLYGATLFAYGVAALDDRWQEYVLAAVMWVFIAMVSSYAVFGIWSMASGRGVDALLFMGEKNLFLPSVTALIVKFLLGRAGLALLSGKNEYHRAEKWYTAGVFACITLVTMGIFCLEAIAVDNAAKSLLTLGILSAELFTAVLFMQMYHSLGRCQRRELERQYREKSMAEQKDEAEALYRMNRELGRFRHDLKGELATVYRLLESGSCTEAKSCLEKLDDSLGKLAEPECPTGNAGLDAALMKCMVRCREGELRFYYVILGNFSQNDPLDMGNLVGNLLNNAVEGCMGAEGKREIDFYIQAQDGGFTIRLRNSIGASVIEHNPKLTTGKEDCGRHGFGMESISGVVEKYAGVYEYWEEDGCFCQKICIPRNINYKKNE